jgi:hypothetical protein
LPGAEILRTLRMTRFAHGALVRGMAKMLHDELAMQHQVANARVVGPHGTGSVARMNVFDAFARCKGACD